MTVTNGIILLVVLIVIVAIVGVRSGPRVTQITRTVRKEKDSGDA